MYTLEYDSGFKSDFKRYKKKKYDISLFIDCVSILEATGKLPQKYKPHTLKGHYKGFMECHIKPDWLLIWLQDDENKVITLVRMGSHDDIF